MLDLFDAFNVKVTCFFLGWVAENYPAIVKEAFRRGHEIASHGFNHQLIAEQSRKEFREDISRSKDVLEQITGMPVFGYRAPSWSIGKETVWALEELASSGYKYDTSIFPVRRENGGFVGVEKGPHIISTSCGPLIEFPISIGKFLGKDWCFSGGGYLRLFPYILISRLAKAVQRKGLPIIVYVHPREIDPHHPRLPMPPYKRFKCYVNLSTTKPKMISLMKDYKFTGFMEWIKNNPDSIRQAVVT
jgi:polysaccharide deacetylase family protein (PEP-CTERM system associated)